MTRSGFQTGQVWRVVTLMLCIGMLVVMLIPGVCPTLTRYISGDETFDAGNYLHPNSWSIFFCWGAFAANCFCILVCILGLLAKTNVPVLVGLFQGAVLVFVGVIFYMDNPLQFWKDGYFLPVVPPILAVGVIVSSLMGFFRDRKVGIA